MSKFELHISEINAGLQIFFSHGFMMLSALFYNNRSIAFYQNKISTRRLAIQIKFTCRVSNLLKAGNPFYDDALVYHLYTIPKIPD